MRSLPKLIPGVHAKLPGDAQEHVKRLYAHAEEHREELNLYITGEEELRSTEARDVASPRPTSRPRPGGARAGREEGPMSDLKLAYWPGCVSRGFTPELHGSMALVAERLGIELVDPRPRELLRRGGDRRAQPGARRHAQRAHLRARPEHRAWR